MTAWNKAGLQGAGITLILLWLFLFHIVGFVLLIASIVVGFPIGLIIYFLKRKKAA